ncbi:DUF4148 domain-containing protein [Variovorax sp. EL159]|uniref:DUF4148 domain-containing protein n=1 Tax=Variovorax sp. EL159 TaxID=1566270 RepID=UPI000A5E0E6A|nr:DUF4148 domain-containing protein [Variovorax sp. EL159]
MEDMQAHDAISASGPASGLSTLQPKEFHMNAKSIALATFTTLALSTGAQAFQGEQNPLPPAPFQSTLSRAQVEADARQPLQISNGGTGVARATAGNVDRAAVRTGALGITRAGAATYGDVTDRRM